MAKKKGSCCGPIAFLIVGIILALVLVGADRAAHAYAENTVASRMRAQFQMPADPQVSIDGFPFVTQVVAKRFQAVSVSGDDVKLQEGENTLTVRHLEAHMTDVLTAKGFSTITATTLDGSVLVDWAESSRLARFPLSYGAGERVQIDATQKVYGQTITLKVSGRPIIDAKNQTLSWGEPRAEVAGYQVPDAVLRTVTDQVVKPQPLNLPYGLRATGVTPQADGLRIGLQGRDTPLVR